MKSQSHVAVAAQRDHAAGGGAGQGSATGTVCRWDPGWSPTGRRMVELARRRGRPACDELDDDWGSLAPHRPAGQGGAGVHGREVDLFGGRTAAGYRLFADEALWCVEVIGGLRALGLTVAEIGSLTDAESQAGARLSGLLAAARARVTTRIEESQQMLARIEAYETQHRADWPAKWISTPATRAAAEPGPSPPGADPSVRRGGGSS